MRSLNGTHVLLLGLPIVFGVLSSSVILPRDIGVALLVLSFVPLAIYAYTAGSLSIICPRQIIYMTTIIVTIMSINTFFGQFGQFRDWIFPLVTFYVFILSMFIVPSVTQEDEFLYAVNRISAVFVLVGIPVILLGNVSILWFTLENWDSTRVLPVLGWEHYPVRSVFSGSQNNASRLFFVGFLAGLYESIQRTSLSSVLFTFINVIGLVLTHSRGAIGVAMIGAGTIIMYHLWRHKGVVLMVLSGFIGSVTIFLSQFGFLPEQLRLVNMSSRLTIWQGGVDGVMAQPLLGHGVGNTAEIMRPFAHPDVLGQSAHSGYLRMFLYTGAIGGLAYIFLIAKPILASIIQPKAEYNVGILSIAIAFMIHHFVGGTPLFGANYYAVAMGLTLGYLIKSQSTHSERYEYTSNTEVNKIRSMTKDDPA